MTITQVRDNLLRLLYLEYNNTVPDFIWQEVTTAINTALQIMHQSPDDYFRKEEIDVTFNAGETEKPISNVLEVIGPVYIPTEDNRELERVNEESEFNQFFQRFYGTTESEAVADGVQEASYYHVKTRRSYSKSSGQDSAGLSIAIKPATTASVTIRAIVAKEAASFSVQEIQDGVSYTPVPAASVETILLPIARWYVMRSHFFFAKDKVEHIVEDYKRAMLSIQISDPDMGTHITRAIKKQEKSPAKK